jgi:hypothetical protein
MASNQPKAKYKPPFTPLPDSLRWGLNGHPSKCRHRDDQRCGRCGPISACETCGWVFCADPDIPFCSEQCCMPNHVGVIEAALQRGEGREVSGAEVDRARRAWVWVGMLGLDENETLAARWDSEAHCLVVFTLQTV